MKYTGCRRGCASRWYRRSWRRYSMEAMMRIRARVKMRAASSKIACAGRNVKVRIQGALTNRKDG